MTVRYGTGTFRINTDCCSQIRADNTGFLNIFTNFISTIYQLYLKKLTLWHVLVFHNESNPRLQLNWLACGSSTVVFTTELGTRDNCRDQGFGAGLFWGSSGNFFPEPAPAPAPGKREHNFRIFEN